MDAYFYHVMEAYKVAKAAQQLLINELNPYERRDYAKYAIESCDMYMKAYPILKNEDKIATFEHALWIKGSYERELESLQDLPPYDYSALERQDQLIITLEYMIATTMNCMNEYEFASAAPIYYQNVWGKESSCWRN
jgi:hypothetical protein